MNNTATGQSFTSENQSRTVQPLLQQAEQQFRAMDYEATFFTLENAVAQNPNSPEALLLRAKFKKIVGMTMEAEEDLRMANRINPMAASLYGYNGSGGLLKILSMQPEEAVQELSTFQKLTYYYQALDDKILDDKNKDAEIQIIGEVIDEIEADNLEGALEMVNKVLIEFPNSAITYDLKGLILKKQGKFEDAVDAFSKAVSVEPDFAIGWYNLGRIERSLNHFKMAKTYLDRSINLQSDLTKAYFERALLFKQIGEKEKALDDYNTIIKMKGDTYMEAFSNRGLTKKMLGDYGGALADLNQAIEEFPQNAELRKNRGNLNLLLGLHRKAIDDYTQAIALNDNYAEAHYNRALAFFLIYDKISGCVDLDKSIDLGYEIAVKTRDYFCTE
ncbi:MAG: tetratricopeptide (TPR) repeat protein [Granulosicoccus sp.]|jgi:tetratricopeptide (TPR) repeat protein